MDKCAKEMIVYRDPELVSLKSYLGKPVKIVFIHHNGWSPLTYRVEEAYGKIYNIGLTDMFDKFTGTGENTFEKCACGDFMLKGSKSGSFRVHINSYAYHVNSILSIQVLDGKNANRLANS